MTPSPRSDWALFVSVFYTSGPLTQAGLQTSRANRNWHFSAAFLHILVLETPRYALSSHSQSGQTKHDVLVFMGGGAGGLSQDLAHCIKTDKKKLNHFVSHQSLLLSELTIFLSIIIYSVLTKTSKI